MEISFARRSLRVIASHRARIRATRWLAMTGFRSDSIVKQREDVRPHFRGAMRPGFASVATLANKRAQGKPGARCTRGLVCKVRKEKCTRAYRFSGGIRPSLRNGFTAYSALSPVNGLSCHRRLAENSTRLDAGIGASEPRDFAVRVSRARQSQHLRPPHPTARS